MSITLYPAGNEHFTVALGKYQGHLLDEARVSVRGCTFEEWDAAGEVYEGSSWLVEINPHACADGPLCPLCQRGEQTTRDMGAYINRVYTERSRGGRRSVGGILS